ncbi:hypothetical protein Taro_007692 [Colocasia esculenta]|uniref:NAC domain-containing protein n=1 Tax=Colocasia esculenta TaxID=4460 RepID=A0A843U0D4_COLES|nr:hypothetical protein [Colocasia esculenta]
MSFLNTMEEKLPPGFRFYPRDEELVSDYLALKARGGTTSTFPMMVDVDLNKCEPWDLPRSACVGGKEWYFYSLRDRKYATGQRTNRATASGYWKATGKDRRVVEPRRGGLVGMRKTLVFYQGRAPRGKKTEWVMHEFRMEGSPAPMDASKLSSNKDDWVLCRVFYKSRGLPAKTSMENCYDDTGSSSLPPLMDTFINFAQDPLELDSYEQVPCFSNYPLGHPPHEYCPDSSALSHVSPAGGDLALRSLTHPGDMPGLGSYLNNTFPCEKKAIKAVLDHFTKMDGGLKMEVPQSLAEGSSESYLTDSSMWNTF